MGRRPAVVPELCGSEQGFVWWRSADGPCLILLEAHTAVVGWRANVAVGRAGSSRASPFQLLLQQLWGSKQCPGGLRAELCDFLGAWILPSYHSDWVLLPASAPVLCCFMGFMGQGGLENRNVMSFASPNSSPSLYLITHHQWL